MAFQDYLTVEGERMLAKAAAGNEIRFTRLVMGSGEIANGLSEKNIKQVIAPEHTIDIGGVLLNGNDSVLVIAVFTNADISEGFYFREKAIFISDGIEEVLAIYGNSREQAEYIDTASFTVIEKRIRSVIKLTQAELSNIVLSSAICAVAPMITGSKIDDFIGTTNVNIIEVGQVLIANKEVYTYIGDDPHNIDCYYSSGGRKYEIDLDVIKKAFEKVFSFQGQIEVEGFNVAIPFYNIFTSLNGSFNDYCTVKMAEYDNAFRIAEGFYIKFNFALGSAQDYSSGTVAYTQNKADIEPAFNYIFNRKLVELFTPLSSAEIRQAIDTQWTGEASTNPFALTPEEIQKAIVTQWTEETSVNPFAITSSQISNIVNKE